MRNDPLRQPVRSVPTAERRARLGVRHHLAVREELSPVTVVRDVVALHATDPPSVYLSVAARSRLVPDDLSRALYDDRTLIRMLGMRRTMFVAPTSTAAVVQHSSSDVVAARLRRRLVQELAAVVDHPDAWLTALEESVVQQLRVRGGSTALALSKAEPRLRTKLVIAEGKAYGGPASIGSRVLNIMSSEGHIVRGRPGGQWSGSNYEWAPVEKWLPDGIVELEPGHARAELLRLWLARFGPGTLADLVWWTGWNLGDTRAALASLDPAVVQLEGEPGFLLADDLEPVPSPEPWIALLPALDPTPMGWIGRDWYLPIDCREVLFDRTGNIGPSIWCNGLIVGGWAQRPDGTVVWRLLRDIGSELTAAVAAEAARLGEWMGEVRVIPKFRTPLEKELAAR
jgi:hypothetical protein